MDFSPSDFPADAHAKLLESVYGPVFMQKLAQAYGIVPSGPEDIRQLLEMAALLRRAVAEQHWKQAAARASVLAEANYNLKQAMYLQSPEAANQAQNAAAYIVSRAMQDPEVLEAARRYGRYLLQMSNVA